MSSEIGFPENISIVNTSTNSSNKKLYITIATVVGILVLIGVGVAIWLSMKSTPALTTTTPPGVIDNNTTTTTTKTPKNIPKFNIISEMPDLIHFSYPKFYTDSGLVTLVGDVKQKMTIQIINISFTITYTDCYPGNYEDIILQIIRPNLTEPIYENSIYKYGNSIFTKYNEKIENTFNDLFLTIESGDQIIISIDSSGGCATLLSDINLKISSDSSITQNTTELSIIGQWITDEITPTFYSIKCLSDKCNNGLYTINVESNNESFILANISANIKDFRGITIPSIYRQIIYNPEYIIYKNYEDSLYTHPIQSSEIRLTRIKGVVITQDGTDSKYLTYTQEANTYYMSSYNSNSTSNLFETKIHKIGIIFIDGFVNKISYKISIKQLNPEKSFSLEFRFFEYSNSIIFTGDGNQFGSISFDNSYVKKGNYLYLILSGYNVSLYNCEFQLHFTNSNLQIPTYIMPINNPDIKPIKTIIDRKMTMDIVKADLDNNVKLIYQQSPDSKYHSDEDSSSNSFSITNYIITNIGITGKIKGLENISNSPALLSTIYNNVPLPCNVTLIINSEFITVDLVNTMSSFWYSFPKDINVKEDDSIILQISGYNAILTETKIILKIIPTVPYNFPKFTPKSGEEITVKFTKGSQTKTINILKATDNLVEGPPNTFWLLYVLAFSGNINETICGVPVKTDDDIGFIPDRLEIVNNTCSQFNSIEFSLKYYYGDKITCKKLENNLFLTVDDYPRISSLIKPEMNLISMMIALFNSEPTTTPIPTTTTSMPTTTTPIPTTTTRIPTTTTPIPTTTTSSNAIYYSKPINLVNSSKLKLQIQYPNNFTIVPTLSIKFTSTPTSLEFLSKDLTKNNGLTPIKNNDILRLHEVGGSRYISNYFTDECSVYDCYFSYFPFGANYTTSYSLSAPKDEYNVFAFPESYNFTTFEYGLPIPTDRFDFTIICFDSSDIQITDTNYIVTSNTKFRLKMRGMYLDGSSSCYVNNILYRGASQIYPELCYLKLTPITSKTPSQLFTFS